MVNDIFTDYLPYAVMENLKTQLLQYVSFSHQKTQATNDNSSLTLNFHY